MRLLVFSHHLPLLSPCPLPPPRSLLPSPPLSLTVTHTLPRLSPAPSPSLPLTLSFRWICPFLHHPLSPNYSFPVFLTFPFPPNSFPSPCPFPFSCPSPSLPPSPLPSNYSFPIFLTFPVPQNPISSLFPSPESSYPLTIPFCPSPSLSLYLPILSPSFSNYFFPIFLTYPFPQNPFPSPFPFS